MRIVLQLAFLLVFSTVALGAAQMAQRPLSAAPINSSLVAAQPIPAQNITNQPPADLSVLLKLQEALASDAMRHREFLQKQVEKHQEFLEKWYDKIKTTASAVVAAILAALGWFGYRSFQEVQKAIRARGEDYVEQRVRDYLLKTADPQLREMEAKVAESTQKIEAIGSEAQMKAARGLLIDALTMLNSGQGQRQEPFLGLIISDARREGFACVPLRASSLRKRQVAILLGRLLRMTQGYPVAIDSLSQFIAIWPRTQARTDRDEPDVHLAALRYNRACYRSCRAEELKKPHDSEPLPPAEPGVEAAPTPESFWSEAWEDLRAACLADPTNVADAKDDPDLASLFRSSSSRTIAQLLAAPTAKD